MKPLYQDLPFPIDSHIHYYIEDLPHFIVPWHYHPAIEIMYITRGIGTRFVGDCIEQYEEGDVCMIGPNLLMNGVMMMLILIRSLVCVLRVSVCSLNVRYLIRILSDYQK